MSSDRHGQDPLRTALDEALGRVEDPEVPITLRDLGVLRDVEVDGGQVTVRMVPTRLGCPALDEMARRVRETVRQVDASLDTRVEWSMESWTPQAITGNGLASLREAGYGQLRRRIRCPYCESEDVRQEGLFGGALCKTPFTCRGCGSTFDALRSALAAQGHDR